MKKSQFTEQQIALALQQAETGTPPGLATVLIGDDPASAIYVNNKQKASREADAVRAFREYHNNPKSRGGLGSIYRYTEARFGRCYDIELKQGLAELNSPELLRQYMPEKAARTGNFAIAKAWAADVKPIYVAKCKFCRICFGTEEELSTALGDHSAMSEMSERL